VINTQSRADDLTEVALIGFGTQIVETQKACAQPAVMINEKFGRPP
jgi:hypothetical protein